MRDISRQPIESALLWLPWTEAHIPQTGMPASGAMGETRQVGNDKTEKGQAENRCFVVCVLQNKAIAGVLVHRIRSGASPSLNSERTGLRCGP